MAEPKLRVVPAELGDQGGALGAARGSGEPPMPELGPLLKAVVGTLVFVGVGLVVFTLAFVIITKITPFSIRKEIEEDQNTALAIVIGSVILGLAWIIAAAIHG